MIKQKNKKTLKIFYLVVITLACLTMASSAHASYGTPPTAPTAPLCEGQTNPTGITDTSPEFSAIFQDPDINDYGMHYQLQVFETADLSGSMWDSGKVAMTNTNIGARSPDITYAGNTLSLDGSTYYWRIRFYDREDTEGAWSSIASFSMNVPPTTPTALLTNGLTNPTEIETTSPYFSAIFQDPNTGDYGTYYQVQVNTSINFDGTSMWDSGLQTMTNTAIGARSPNITYGGNALSFNGTTYYWRIRFSDNQGGVGNWSTAGSFATANLGPERPTSCLLKRNAENTELLILWDTELTGVEKFIIQRNVNDTGFADLDTNVSSSLREYTDDSTTAGNKYQYQIAIVKNQVTGEWCQTPALNIGEDGEGGGLEFQGINLEGLNL
jgi:hypothetical protein